MREVLNGIFHVPWTVCRWKALPKDLPPKSTVHDYLELWNWDSTLERIHQALYVAVREQKRREASPMVAIIDSQTAKVLKEKKRTRSPTGREPVTAVRLLPKEALINRAKVAHWRY